MPERQQCLSRLYCCWHDCNRKALHGVQAQSRVLCSHGQELVQVNAVEGNGKRGRNDSWLVTSQAPFTKPCYTSYTSPCTTSECVKAHLVEKHRQVVEDVWQQVLDGLHRVLGHDFAHLFVAGLVLHLCTTDVRPGHAQVIPSPDQHPVSSKFESPGH